MASGHSSGVQFLSEAFSRWQVFPGKTALLVCFLEVSVALWTLPLLRCAEQFTEADTALLCPGKSPMGRIFPHQEIIFS